MKANNKTGSYVRLKPETMAKIHALAESRTSKDQEDRTNPILVTQLVNEAYDKEVVK